ncbi:FAD-dependent oxidoreductase [Bradyrhizobium sp. CSA207]|uniref:NAD(P)/FAD-dependent oxidoreductase n=1 Tax=Bradyrhizobium sp. CSA207 TaxID=2698826 RepID=UPI0023B08631|nr:FAD-dependent oxidoreductase [Bradyrhizobium sp. CSA207]MDE5446758.1 FAD-dependent oxidoreductase [Bradyrhizobium sp. CSA207]
MSKGPAIVIVGAGQAGTAAAIALREAGWQGLIALIGNEALGPYERPPLSKATLLEETDLGPKLLVTPERLAELSISHFQGRNVVSIDRAAHTVTLSDGTQLAYERLLLTTGARPRRLSIPTAEGSRVAVLRTYADALVLRRFISPRRKVVVIGGGFIGLEVAASAVARGASVTVIESGPRLLMRAVPSSMAELIKAKHERSGVRVETGATVERVGAVEGRSKVILAEGRTHLADLVVVGIGAAPNIELAHAAGLAVNNGIALNEMLATSDPDIFAAGDCCSFPHRLYGERIRLEAWRNAQRQGAVAAANILGANRPYDDVPWFWSDQYDETLQIAGLYREEHFPVSRNLGANGRVVFYLAADGRLVAACGFGSLGAIAKEIRLAEMFIGRRLAPKVEALADPAVNIKSLLI